MNGDGGARRRRLAIDRRARRPLAVLAGWAALTAALAVLGVGVGAALSPSVVIAPGTAAARAQQLAERRFGPTQLVPILLEGPAQRLDAQGPRLVAALAQRRNTRVLSPWNAPAGTEGLRPSAGAAMVLVSLQVSEARAIEEQPAIERIVATHTASPVDASITGQPSIDRALREHALAAALEDGLIAVGVLLALALILLRAPVAAALITLVAAASAIAGLGAIRLLGGLLAIDPVAVPLGAMSGLALGGAYALIVLDRFRREPVRPLAASAALAEGRGVLLAGGGLIAALLAASAIAPTKVIVSVGAGVLACGALAALTAAVALPAALALLGERAAWTLPAPAFAARGFARLQSPPAAVSRRMLIAAPVAVALLALLALPLLTLKTGQPGIQQLPSGAQARVSFERVAKVMGPGWPTPYTVVIAEPQGPITTAPMLAELQLLQAQIETTRSVASVSGPGGLSSRTKPLGKLPSALRESGKLLTGGRHDLKRLLTGLGQAGSGAQQLQGGLQSAAAGAAQLHSGSGSAQAGAAKLHAGLAKARDGSALLQAGLGEALAGARALQNGATQALAGSVELHEGVSSVGAPVHTSLPSTQQLKDLTAATNGAIGSLKGQADSAGGAVSRGLGALEAMTSGRSDPRYEEALQALQEASGAIGGVSGGLASAAPNAGLAAQSASTLATQTAFLDAALAQLKGGAVQLQVGLGKLRAGNAKLVGGIGRLSRGGGELTSGLTRLRDGAGELEAGLGLLTGGSGELQAGLQGGVAPVGRLVGGLGLLEAGVAKFSGQLPSPKDLEELRRNSPGLFSSGYFLLAAIEGAPPQARNAAAFTINVERGGNAAQIAVISRYPSGAAPTAALGDRLTAQSRQFARINRVLTGLGGPAANLRDLTDVASARTWWAIGGAALLVLLVLAAGLRAVPFAALADALALLAAAASFGLLTLLFSGASALLGGPGHLDPISEIGIFAAMLGVGLAFLTPALLELRGRRANSRRLAAAERDLAPPLGGVLAGLLAVAALVPFAASASSAVSQFAIGVAIGAALSALLVRTLVLPVAVKLLGDRGWWPGCAQVRSRKPRSAPSADAKRPPMRPTGRLA